MKRRTLLTLLSLGLAGITSASAQEEKPQEEKPHIVLVVGTLHYSPELTMPRFAQELERFGFRTTVVVGEGNPERKTADVLPGIEALAEADLVIFFKRFLQLPDKEWQPIVDYLKTGKPVLGLRTAGHAFKYPAEHPRHEWNDGFGRRVFGSPYIVHQKGTTKTKVVEENAQHPIMAHVVKREWTSPGTLYLAQLEEGCLPLLTGTGSGPSKIVKKDFGDIKVNELETAPIAWAWQNEWGAKSFYTSLGHPGDFAEESFHRMLINAVHWGLDLPPPPAQTEMPSWKIKRADHKKKKNKKKATQ